MISIDETLFAKTKAIINKYNFSFKKNFGQNFLIDSHVLSKIMTASEICENDVVIEIGPGIGTLTAAAAERAFKVIAVEIDRTLIPILEDTLSRFNNVEIVNEDILKFDVMAIADKYGDKKLKVVANLPYYITTPIIMDILEKRLPVESITVMVQKEVAYRMGANPSTKDYGALSLLIQYFCEPYIAANVPRNCFIPRPNVDSAVIKLDVLKNPPVEVMDRKLMFDIIKSAFSQRRKTLLNCIFNTGGFGFSKDEILEILNQANFDERVRGETLTLSDFALLADVIFEKKGNGIMEEL